MTRSARRAGPRRADSARPADLAVAAVDRAGADELPAVAVVGGPAGRADHPGFDDRLAADLADRRAGVLGVGRARPRRSRSPGRAGWRRPIWRPSWIDQRLVDGEEQRLGLRGEVAVDLHEQPLGVDRDEHPRRRRQPLEVRRPTPRTASARGTTGPSRRRWPGRRTRGRSPGRRPGRRRVPLGGCGGAGRLTGASSIRNGSPWRNRATTRVRGPSD